MHGPANTIRLLELMAAPHTRALHNTAQHDAQAGKEYLCALCHRIKHTGSTGLHRAAHHWLVSGDALVPADGRAAGPPLPSTQCLCALCAPWPSPAFPC